MEVRDNLLFIKQYTYTDPYKPYRTRQHFASKGNADAGNKVYLGIIRCIIVSCGLLTANFAANLYTENESENKKNNPLGLSGLLWCWEHFGSVYWGMLQYPIIGINMLYFNSLGGFMYL